MEQELPDLSFTSGVSWTPEQRRNIEQQRERVASQLHAFDQLLYTPCSITSESAMVRTPSLRKRTYDCGPPPMLHSMSSNRSQMGHRPMARPRNSSLCHQRPAIPLGMNDFSPSLPSGQTLMDPSEYLSSQAGSYESSSKRARVGMTDSISPQSSFCSSLEPDTITPGLLSTSFLSQPSTLSSQSIGMSRHSSVSGLSSIGRGLDMVRIQSTASYAPSEDVFAIDDISKPVVPSVIRTAPTWDDRAHETIFDPAGWDTYGPDVLQGVGSEFDHAKLKYQVNHDFAQPVDIGNSEPMGRSLSNSSSTSTNSSSSAKSTAERKASERNQRHIQNSKQAIVPKNISPASRSPKTAGHAKAAKQAISKVPYRRASQPKKFCQHCNERPDGFHGIHELRRHEARAHALTRKAWICVQPATLTSGHWPERALSACKNCVQHKPYNAYYNAAAHIRRAHFHPKRRGRRPKGAPQPSRAGKTGGEDPTIAWLKANGWLQEIEVTREQWDEMQTTAQPSEHEDCANLVEDDADEEVHAEGMPAMFDEQAYPSTFDSGLFSQQSVDEFGVAGHSFWSTEPSEGGDSFQEMYGLDGMS